jgi:hypothetical protein
LQHWVRCWDLSLKFLEYHPCRPSGN